MERKIKIIAGNTTAEASLFNTTTADAIWNSLPLESSCNLWGDEIYFTIPISHSLEKDAREIVGKGDLGYWPHGPALCIFFGLTPISKGNEIRPASAVNVFGKIIGDPTIFKHVSSGTLVRVEKVG
ncbi:MAG: hypothetical protein AMJ42_00355 [Deltaproteobacteria bacterium DG_8]|nr:MAG: hypothetical protein AMJ42_00355 [Deltaproteobacteria bacterium DG_8]